MKNKSKECCETCKFYKLIDGLHGAGECHRNPPSVKISDTYWKTDNIVCWPKVYEDQWCGEYKNENL